MGIPVKGFRRYEIDPNGTVRNILTGRLLRGRVNLNGYRIIELVSDDGYPKQLLLHRLVAQTFIPNPQGLPFVNHKDENPLNCSADNLEWCTPKYNINYGTCIAKRTASMAPFYASDTIKEQARINGQKASKPVAQYTPDGKLVARYPSGKEAARRTGCHHSHLLECCAGKRYKTVGGYVWKYERSVDLLASR